MAWSRLKSSSALTLALPFRSGARHPAGGAPLVVKAGRSVIKAGELLLQNLKLS